MDSKRKKECIYLVNEYLGKIIARFKSGLTTEHSFRGDLQLLLEALLPGIVATNEPKRVKCGAPDYILTKNEIPIGYIEAKDIGKDLKSKDFKEQFDRYRDSLPNLIFTDYLDFHFYKNGEFITSIKIADLIDNKITICIQNIDAFIQYIHDFALQVNQTIKSSLQLAKMMAGKARLLADIIEKSLLSDDENYENSTLQGQMGAFKEILIHDITPKGFADVYAQTIAYGMFAARLHDPTLQTFSRHEAAELIPKSNPFLRKLFGYIAGPDLDDRIKWIVDNLTEIFLACNVEEILKSYGKTTKMEDPIIHFYETFLAEYDPKLRKARGVWYTPAPVVNFIVRAVDDILKTEFDLPQGLADTSKTKFSINTQTPDKRSSTGYKQMEQEVHKVQILDPSTGTGTFLAEVIKHVHKKFKGQEGIWSGYVENHLLPRLNGFELLMASYAMAHLQLDLLLKETGYKTTTHQRTRVYLTNSLEEHHPDTGTLFSSWLSSEANEANHIKRDTPVMCVIGNPPYSGESANKGNWIMDLMEDYKKEPGGKEKLKERNPKWINDDYVKFMRYGQHFIEKKGNGVLAFITPHGFLDNPTFRGMRWNLLKTYDKLYIIDLHGNSKKKEIAPDGSIDQNVFDIMQGVSINILVKTGKKKASELGELYKADCYGPRNLKYDWLSEHTLKSIQWSEVTYQEPSYLFVQKDHELLDKYDKGFMLNQLFPVNSVGIVTSRDHFVIDDEREKLTARIKEFIESESSTDQLKAKYNLRENQSWKITEVKSSAVFDEPRITKISYRPFDQKYIYYDSLFIERSRGSVMKHYIGVDNLGLLVTKAFRDSSFAHCFCTQNISEAIYLSGVTASNAMNIPLYLYPENTYQQSISNNPTERTPNLNKDILNEIGQKLELTFTPEKEDDKSTFAPIDLFDYIYAVLHSPTYRGKYQEFLKIDFPRVPYPEDIKVFWELVRLGDELRQIHLLEHPCVTQYITTYPNDGDNTITRKINKNDFEITNKDQQIGRIWINDQQYVDKIPLIAWEFYIGGYQPAQKWLKDRRGRELSFEDIQHYQKIIVSLTKTDRIMQEIDFAINL